MAGKCVIESMDNVIFALGLYEKFLQICPEKIWDENFGGWPVGRQIYHALSLAAIFLSTMGVEITNPSPEAGNLGERGGTAPAKENAAQFLSKISKAVEELAASLTMEDLARKNDKLSRMMGRDTANEAALTLMGRELLYHLGSCDAALRQGGLAGAF